MSMGNPAETEKGAFVVVGCVTMMLICCVVCQLSDIRKQFIPSKLEPTGTIAEGVTRPVS
jgi:hypothetical protein